MALSGLDIYKLLPKTNCRECGFVTCLAFAMQVAKRQVTIDKCPYVSEEAKRIINETSLPPIRLIKIGEGNSSLCIGNETVLFRHEEKFYHPCGLGFIIDDALADEEIKTKLDLAREMRFERVGQLLKPEIIAIRQIADKKRYLDVIKKNLDSLKDFCLVLISNDVEAQKQALEITYSMRPLLYAITLENLNEFLPLVKKFSIPIVASAENLDSLNILVQNLNQNNIIDIVLEVKSKNIKDRIWDFTQIRRQALKRINKNFGYPIFMLIENNDISEILMEAATFICKYASIILFPEIEEDLVLSILTLRQNIYSDPQKPLQVEPKIYSVGKTNNSSPVLITTNFSLTYYTVLGEVEASRIPSYILSVDTEGMSVLTAWAAEKFTADRINEYLIKFSLKELVSHRRLIIPGYVAIMSGELEEKSGWQVIVGPKEASGIPSFLKNLLNEKI